MPPDTKKSFLKDTGSGCPYSLFGIPVSNSPPTPVDRKTKKAAAKRRCQKRAAQPLIVSKNINIPTKPSSSERKSISIPQTIECKVILEKLDLSKLRNEVHRTEFSENFNPNVRSDRLLDLELDESAGLFKGDLHRTIVASPEANSGNRWVEL